MSATRGLSRSSARGLTILGTSGIAPADAGNLFAILESGDKGCGRFIPQGTEVERLAVETKDTAGCASEACHSLRSGH